MNKFFLIIIMANTLLAGYTLPSACSYEFNDAANQAEIEKESSLARCNSWNTLDKDKCILVTKLVYEKNINDALAEYEECMGWT
jgi:hypothetical protein